MVPRSATGGDFHSAGPPVVYLGDWAWAGVCRHLMFHAFARQVDRGAVSIVATDNVELIPLYGLRIVITLLVVTGVAGRFEVARKDRDHLVGVVDGDLAYRGVGNADDRYPKPFAVRGIGTHDNGVGGQGLQSGNTVLRHAHRRGSSLLSSLVRRGSTASRLAPSRRSPRGRPQPAASSSRSPSSPSRPSTSRSNGVARSICSSAATANSSASAKERIAAACSRRARRAIKHPIRG